MEESNIRLFMPLAPILWDCLRLAVSLDQRSLLCSQDHSSSQGDLFYMSLFLWFLVTVSGPLFLVTVPYQLWSGTISLGSSISLLHPYK